MEIKRYDEFTKELDENVNVQDAQPVNEVWQATLYDGEVINMWPWLIASISIISPVLFPLIKFIVTETVNDIKDSIKNKRLAKLLDKLAKNEKVKNYLMDKFKDDETFKKALNDENFKPKEGWGKYLLDKLGKDGVQQMQDAIYAEDETIVSDAVKDPTLFVDKK